MSNSTFPILALGLMIAVLPQSGRAAVNFVDPFDSYTPGAVGDDAAFDALYTTPGGTAIVAGTGLGGSQALSITADSQLVRDTTPIDLIGEGTSVTVSIYFQYPGSSGIAGPQIGLTVAPSGNVTGAGDLTGRVNNGNLQLRQNNGTISTGPALSLTTGSWYQLATTIERTATPDTFNMTVAVYASDAAGVITGLVNSHSDSTTDATFYADSDTYVVLRENTAIDRLDNLAVAQVPEPSLSALAGLALLGLAFRRQRS